MNARERRLAEALARRGSPEFAEAGAALVAAKAANKIKAEAEWAANAAAHQAEVDARVRARKECDDAVMAEFRADMDAAMSDCLGDNPELHEDDVFHDLALNIVGLRYAEHPAEVNEFWRVEFGWRWDQRHGRAV